MKKLLLLIGILGSTSLLHSDLIRLDVNPRVLFRTTNTWTAAQNFSSATFSGNITVAGCTGCGSGGGGSGGSGAVFNGVATTAVTTFTVSGAQFANLNGFSTITVLFNGVIAASHTGTNFWSSTQGLASIISLALSSSNILTDKILVSLSSTSVAVDFLKVQNSSTDIRLVALAVDTGTLRNDFNTFGSTVQSQMTSNISTITAIGISTTATALTLSQRTIVGYNGASALSGGNITAITAGTNMTASQSGTTMTLTATSSGGSAPSIQNPATGYFNMNNSGISNSTGIGSGQIISEGSATIKGIIISSTGYQVAASTVQGSFMLEGGSIQFRNGSNEFTMTFATIPSAGQKLGVLNVTGSRVLIGGTGDNVGTSGGGSVPTIQNPSTGPYVLRSDAGVNYGIVGSSGIEVGNGLQLTNFMSTVAAIINSLSLSTQAVQVEESPDISNRTYYVRDESTGNASNYRLLATSPAVTAEVTRSASITSANGLVRVSSHVTLSNEPGVNKIPAGVWDFTSWVNASILNSNTQLVVTVSTMSIDGSTVGEVTSATSTNINDSGSLRFDMSAVQINDVFITTADRIIVQYFFRTTSALAVTVNLFYAGTTRFTHVITPLGSVNRFIQLADAPNTLQGSNGKLLGVNDDQTATVFLSSALSFTFSSMTITSTATMANVVVSSGLRMPIGMGVFPSTGQIIYDSTQDVVVLGGYNGWPRATVPVLLDWKFAANDSMTDDTNAGAETSFVTASTVPARWFQNGRGIIIKFFYDLTLGASPPTMTVKVKLGATTVLTNGAFGPVASVTRGQGITLDIMGSAPPGTSVPVYVGQECIPGNAGAVIDNSIAPQPTNVNTTAALPINVTWQFASNVANTHQVNLTQLQVWGLGN